MGRKHEKSKGRRKKRRRQQKAAPTAASGSANESHEDRDVEPEGPDEDEGTDPGDGAQEPPVDAVIDVGDGLDDPEARADLVAAAAGLTDPPDDPKATASDDEEATASDDDAKGARDEEGVSTSEDEGVAASDEKAGGDAPAGDDLPATDEAGGEDTPLIRPDALLVLSEFREEGVATIPEELVLDLGEAASAEERDRLLAAALAHVEMQDAIYRVPLESGTTRRWKGLLAAAIFIMALLVAGLPPGFLVPEAPPPLSTGERLRGIRTALLLQAEQVEAFRIREERLPTSLAQVETALPGIRFVRSSSRLYQLVAYTPDGEAVVYDSASPDPAFSEVRVPWLAPEDGP